MGGENAIKMLGHCGWLPVHCYVVARGVSSQNQNNPGFYDILIPTFGVCDNYGILPFYHTHLLLPTEILEQGLGQKGMLVEKKPTSGG